MYILAIETTGAFASVCLAEQTDSSFEVKSSVEGHDRFSHLQNLTPQIQQVLGESGLAIGDIDVIAVSEGPGSFTGIRIGVSTARALSQVTGIKVATVPTLSALAGRACEAFAEEELEGKLVCPILDARRSQVYGGGYMIEEGMPVEKVKAGPYTIDEFLEAISQYDQLIFLGDGVDTCGAKLPEGALTPEEIRYQQSMQVARLGGVIAADGQTKDYMDVEPQYMRLAEAERKLMAEKKAKEAGK